jgi:hypothetical protein
MSDPRKVMVVGSGAVFTGMNARVVCADSNNNNTITPNSMQINKNLLISSNPEATLVNTNKVIVNESGTTTINTTLNCLANMDVHIKAEKKFETVVEEEKETIVKSIEMNVNDEPTLQFNNGDSNASIKLKIDDDSNRLEVSGNSMRVNCPLNVEYGVNCGDLNCNSLYTNFPRGNVNPNGSTSQQLDQLLAALNSAGLITRNS